MLFWILIIAAFIIIAGIFFKLFGRLWKAILPAMGIISVILIIFGVMAIMDARNFADEFPKSKNLFMLAEDGRMLAGAIYMQGEMKPLTESEFSGYSSSYSEGNFKALLGDKYRVFIFSTGTFASVEDEIIGENYDKETILLMLRSDDALDSFIDNAVEKAGIIPAQEELFREKLRNEAPAEAELRSSLFIILLQAFLKEGDPVFLLAQYKQDNIRVYPETMLFKMIRVVPNSVFENIEAVAK